jgi:hypothetical protein
MIEKIGSRYTERAKHMVSLYDLFGGSGGILVRAFPCALRTAISSFIGHCIAFLSEVFGKQNHRKRESPICYSRNAEGLCVVEGGKREENVCVVALGTTSSASQLLEVWP